MVQVPGLAEPGIAAEVWGLPAAAFGAFVARIPAPLAIGKVELADGSRVSGFLCAAHALAGAGAEEITRFGGWRAFRAQAREVSEKCPCMDKNRGQ